MPLYRTPLVDKAQPLIFTPGVSGYSPITSGCATPYFQRVLLDVTKAANIGAAIGGGVGGWGTPGGLLARGTFTAFTGSATLSDVSDATVVVSQHLAALITDLKAAGILKA